MRKKSNVIQNVFHGTYDIDHKKTKLYNKTLN